MEMKMRQSADGQRLLPHMSSSRLSTGSSKADGKTPSPSHTINDFVMVTNKSVIVNDTKMEMKNDDADVKKRGHIIKEILETEQIYYDDISKFLRYFLSSFRSQDKPIKKMFMSKSELVSLCANLEQIASVSQQLIEELKDAIRKSLPHFQKFHKNNSNNSTSSDVDVTLWCAARCAVGPVFQKFTAMLQLYAHYASNFSLSQTDVKNFMKDPNFVEVWEECGQIASNMITPVSNSREASTSSNYTPMNKAISRRASYAFVLSNEVDTYEEPKKTLNTSQNSLLDPQSRQRASSLGQGVRHVSNSSIGSVGSWRSDVSHSTMSENEKRPPAIQTRLDGFLILPIQRLPRYELLLKELIKTSLSGAPPDSSDFLDWEEEMRLLKDCLVEIEASNAHMNDAIKFSEKKQTLLELQKQFVPGTIIDLIGDSLDGNQRTLVSEGELVKIGRSGHKPYYFHLLTDAIMYSQETSRGLEFHRALMLDAQSSVEEAPAPTSNSYLTYINPTNRNSTAIVKRSSLTIQAGTVRDLIKLFSGGKVPTSNGFSSNKKYLIKDDPRAATATNAQEGPKSTAFRIITRKKTFVVYAASYHIKAVWMKHIKNVIQQLRERGSTDNRSNFGTQSSSRDFKTMTPSGSSRNLDLAQPRSKEHSESNGNERGHVKTSSSSSISSIAESRVFKPLTEAEMQVYQSCKLCGSSFGIFRKRHQCRRCALVVCSNCGNKTRVLDGYEPERVCFVCSWEMDSTISTDFPDCIRLCAQVKQAKTGKNIEILVGGDKREVVKKTYFSVSTPTPIKSSASSSDSASSVLTRSQQSSKLIYRGPSSVGVLDKTEGLFVVPLSVDIASYGQTQEPYMSVQMWIVDIGEIGSVQIPLIEIVRHEKIAKVGQEPFMDWYELKLRPAVAAQLGVASVSGGRTRSFSVGTRSRSQSASSRPRSNTATSRRGSSTASSSNEPAENDEQKIFLQLSFTLLPPPNLYNFPKIEKNRSYRAANEGSGDHLALVSVPMWSDPLTWKRYQNWKTASEAPFPYSLIAPPKTAKQQVVSNPPPSRSSKSEEHSPDKPPHNLRPDPYTLKDYEKVCETRPTAWSVLLTNLVYNWAMDDNLFIKDDDRKLTISNKLKAFQSKQAIAAILSFIEERNRSRLTLVGSAVGALARSYSGQSLKSNGSDRSLVKTSEGTPRSAHSRVPSLPSPPPLQSHDSYRKMNEKPLNEPIQHPIVKQLVESEGRYIEMLDTLFESFALPILEFSGGLSLNPNISRSASSSASSQAIRVRRQAVSRIPIFSKSELDEREVKLILTQMDISLLFNSVQQLKSMHEKFFGDLQKIYAQPTNLANVESALRGFFALLKVYYIYASSFCSVSLILLGTQREIEGADPKMYESILNDWLCKGGGFLSPIDASRVVLYFIDDLLASGIHLGGSNNTSNTKTQDDLQLSSSASSGSARDLNSIGSSILPNISQTAREGIRRLVESCESDDRCKGRNLEQFLSAPLQRLSDYKQLLQQLAASSPASSSFDRVSRNLDETLSYLTKAIVSRPNLEYLSTIASSLTTLPETIKLVNVHRWLIREGYLVKRSKKEDEILKFWLFCDCIIYGKRTGKFNKFGFQKIIWLRDAAIRDLGDEGTASRGSGEQLGDCKNAFELISMNESFVCMIPSSVEFSGSRVGVGSFSTSSVIMSFTNTNNVKAGFKWTQVERTKTRLEWVADISKCIEMDATRGVGETICWANDIPLLSNELEENEYFIESQKNQRIKSQGSTIVNEASTINLLPTLSNEQNVASSGQIMTTAATNTIANENGIENMSIKAKRRNSRKFNQNERINMAAPIMELSGTAIECNICSKQFSLILPSHNCRNCGKLVCAKCSKEKRILEHINKTIPLRVCDNCIKIVDNS